MFFLCREPASVQTENTFNNRKHSQNRTTKIRRELFIEGKVFLLELKEK